MIFDAQFFDALDKVLGVFNRRLRQNSVTEIENVSRALSIALQHPFRFLTNLFTGREKHGRVHISLQSLAAVNLTANRADFLCPINAERIAFQLRKRRVRIHTLCENNHGRAAGS